MSDLDDVGLTISKNVSGNDLRLDITDNLSNGTATTIDLIITKFLI
jgi:hypothetical protein